MCDVMTCPCDRCDSDGSWLTEQCNDKLGVCWCVTPNGFVVPKTRVRGVAQCQWGECMPPVSVLSLSTPPSLHALWLPQSLSLSLPFFLSISHPSVDLHLSVPSSHGVCMCAPGAVNTLRFVWTFSCITFSFTHSCKYVYK